MQLPGPVGRPHPRPGHTNPPPTQGDRPSPMPCRYPARAALSLPSGPHSLGHILIEHGGHDLQAGTGGQSRRPPSLPGDLGHRHDHLLGDADLSWQWFRRGTADPFWELLLTAVPFHRVFLVVHP